MNKSKTIRNFQDKDYSTFLENYIGEEDSDNSLISSFESIELRVFLIIFLLELNEILRSLSIYF